MAKKFNGKVISRKFSTDNDGMVTECQHVDDHDNCYVLSSNERDDFIIPSSAVLEEENIDCSKIAKSIGRKVSTCNLYFMDFGENEGVSTTKRCYVESDTFYPLKCIGYSDDSNGFYLTTIENYKSFSPEKPSDESGLKPFSGVSVYDFRNGKGDAGDGKSNIYNENSISNDGRKLFNWKSSSMRNEEEKDKTDIYRHSIQRGKAIRDNFHLPLMGIPSGYAGQRRSNDLRDDTPIPDSFDSRENWGYCSQIIGTITDQGVCGSCWAMASAGVVSDRLCIHDSKKMLLSPRYLVGCAMDNCGCWGGSTIQTWYDIKKIGIPSELCLPFRPRDELCPEVCDDFKNISEDIKVFPTGFLVAWGKTATKREEAIQREIMTNGPVMASFLVFNDFYDFWNKKAASGDIYHRSADSIYDGGHSVRIIGWGTKPGHKYCEKYWLVANSWGTKKVSDGLFRICRGNNECNIEEEVAAGYFA